MKRNVLLFTIYIFGIFFFLNLCFCKKNNLPLGIKDERWREESSELVSAYCQKLASCTKGVKDSSSSTEPPDLKHSSQELIQERLKPANCAEKFRNSNAYLLANENPETIKKVVRSCFQTVIGENCEKVRRGVLKLSEDCVRLQIIQFKQD
ncbi:LA_2478/LA_2722/LA_4182 family protein [Leptospira borgpetersenii]|uniref:Uncharacterized protein n=2 Tax=Leptospira borgpetersenii TaxID=174 RepID=A0A0E3B5Y0_LEPBO|nr:hypothetical protein [Leptospira borgpetersenii]ALO27926.1 hypothetical protein LBBP_03757 [Leptospira borgpetersenii serovar Ballum]APY25137.1 Uncharacterized protein LB4E_2947 [Leptospira borgpetersenii str. 4E]EMN17011.1 hypothetical protein LEP1GSC056_2456 [Leptospira borgpetersenii str. Brem 328]KGE26236.1 hypothetical protein IQ66_02500 [Leptospira borgpetersenii serovar Ballum]MBE8159276.1 hypothetical protein [Leptospira borgpetersenii serovar Ballum]